MDVIPAARGVKDQKVDDAIEKYLEFHDDTKEDHNQLRKTQYADMINKYYDMATDFYEWGWGTSFHFARRHSAETFQSSIARSEHYIALKMKLEPDQKIIDLGCGVGGPAREISRFADVHVVGVNNNQYQIDRANIHTKRQNLKKLQFVKGDFMHIPFDENSFDGAYQIEATAHAPDKVAAYAEIFRVLKPGACFASYEWCLTPEYDSENPKHRLAKKWIEEGDGLPDISTTVQVVEALKEAGFEIEIEEDRGLLDNDADYSWYQPLEPRYTPSNFKLTPVGQFLIGHGLNLMERVGVVPKGTSKVQSMLLTGAKGLVVGGQEGIFTPTFFTLARKPLDA